MQHYTDPFGNPILSLADTQWFGPQDIWPKLVENYPYIDFWHLLDQRLADENIYLIGIELLGDKAWNTLFDVGPLDENPDIVMRFYRINREYSFLFIDQVGTERPLNYFVDIGAIEK